MNWDYLGDALPAFVTIVTMPFSYSVAYGLIAGLFTYVVLNGMIYVTRKVSGWVLGEESAIEPPDADMGEYWTYKIGSAPWFLRAVQMQKWRSGGHAVFVDEDVGEVESRDADGHVGSDGASEKELVEVLRERDVSLRNGGSRQQERERQRDEVGHGSLDGGFAGSGNRKERRDRNRGVDMEREERIRMDEIKVIYD